MRSMRKGTVVDIYMTNSVYDKCMNEGIMQKIYLRTIHEENMLIIILMKSDCTDQS